MAKVKMLVDVDVDVDKKEYVLITDANEMIDIDLAIKGYLIQRAKSFENIKEALDKNERLLKTHKIIMEALYNESSKFLKQTIKEMEEAIKEVKNETDS